MKMQTLLLWRYLRFNRYMVECECVTLRKICRMLSVLIDTWWNVNIVACGALAWYIKVLIDTWWNVNLQRFLMNLRQCVCFNRYMVECESMLTEFVEFYGNCFNRYMVECESSFLQMQPVQ